jgi:hypothetical protein
MGHLVKNTKIHTASYAIRMPVASQIAQTFAPQYPQDGQVRFNVYSNQMEIYYSNQWRGVTLSGRVAIDNNIGGVPYYGDGTTTDFSITQVYQSGHEAELIVFVGGIYQTPGTAYTVSSNIVTFTSAPDLGLPITILQNFNSTHIV